MRRHRLRQAAVIDSDSDSDNSTADSSDSDSRLMRCISCKEEYSVREAGTCKECYEEASETEEELKREIAELKAKVCFLRFGSPLDQTKQSHTDVLLVASDDTSCGVPIAAHKSVLVSRSSVFRAMLENEMEESRSGTIKISDVSYDALRAFVTYMYTAETCLDEQLGYDLLVLAEKYEVKHLKSYCETFLISKLNWDNSLINYMFAHQHNSKNMVEAALSVITDNMEKLLKQEEYLELVERDPRIVVQIYEAYLSKQVNTAAPKEASSSKG